MKILCLNLFLLFFTINGYSQLLSVTETINYINQLSKENTTTPVKHSGCQTHIYNQFKLQSDGYLIITSFWKTYDCSANSLGKEEEHWTYERKMHITEIDVQGIEINYTEALIIPCKEGQCISIKAGPQVSSPSISSNNKKEFLIWGGDNYSKKKLKNALKYLIGTAIERGDYNRGDDDDPFAPENFKGTKYQVSSQSKSTNIQLSKEGGVSTLIVSFGNGQVEKRFILDTGAGQISISESLEQKLISNSIIKKENYISPGLFQIADGSIISCRRLIIPSIDVGGFKVYNVMAAVGTNNSPLLLGKNFLDKFSSWSINNETNSLILNK